MLKQQELLVLSLSWSFKGHVLLKAIMRNSAEKRFYRSRLTRREAKALPLHDVKGRCCILLEEKKKTAAGSWDERNDAGDTSLWDR